MPTAAARRYGRPDRGSDRLPDVDWDAVKQHLRALAAEHGGRGSPTSAAGRAHEYVVVRGDTVREEGVRIEYPSGSRQARPEVPDPGALVRVVPAWAPAED